ncbi:MAG: MFS transporter [Myxococcota bacterium]
MQESPEQQSTEREVPERGPVASRRYANYVLGLLFVVYTFNFIDRQILSILLEDIKTELGVSDTAMGFLTGIAFAAFYTVAGIPIARWADVGVRRSIIALGLAVWSAMTALSGVVQSFTQLVGARIGVGVGEAAGSPPAHSIIADYFPPERRATALSIYNMGINVGILFGFLAGGWINEFFGWRAAFFVVGLPGLALALLVRFTIREPPRGASEGTVTDEPPEATAVVFRFLWSLRSFRHLAIAGGLHAFTGYGLAQWSPTFLRRVHEFGSGEAGTYLGLIIGLGGIAGSLLGGVLADRLSIRDKRWYLWVPAISSVLTLPFIAGFLLFDSPALALVTYIPAVVFGAMWLGSCLAITQAMVKLRMRAMASAILILVLNLIGLGLGPQAVGIMNDLLAPSLGDEAIRYSLLLATLMTAWAAVHFALAARSLREDLEAKNRMPDAAGAPVTD